VSKFVQVVQKWLGTNKFVRTKSHIGSKFPKISLGLLCTQGIVVVHLYCIFPAASDGATAERQIQYRIFGQFLPFWGRISPVMHRFGLCFHRLLED